MKTLNEKFNYFLEKIDPPIYFKRKQIKTLPDLVDLSFLLESMTVQRVKATDSELKVVYLASPYSHKLKKVEAERYELTNKLAAGLHARYPHAFIMPITQSHTMRKYNKDLGTSFEKWAARDLKFIEHSNEVWVLLIPGWKQSIGVTAEVEFAEAQGIPVRYINPKTLNLVQKPRKR